MTSILTSVMALLYPMREKTIVEVHLLLDYQQCLVFHLQRQHGGECHE